MRQGWVRSAVLCSGFLVLILGCGRTKGTLQGQLTAQGKPVEAATVLVRGGNGEVATGTAANGRYSVEGVTGGVVKIAVIPTGPDAAGGTKTLDPKAMREKGNFGADRAKKEEARARDAMVAAGILITAEYQDLETTPLTHDTASGFTKDIAIP